MVLLPLLLYVAVDCAAAALTFLDPSTAAMLRRGAGFPQPPADVSAGLQSPTICDPHVKQHSGYLAAGLAKHLFFWLFESRNTPATDPLVVWLTGGPGCSSQLALLAENGPCTLPPKGNATATTPNPFSWTARANVMWVDQPGGTGFSTGMVPPDLSERDVAEDFYRFMQAFYVALPQYKANPLYIFGESYAGHYVPAVGHRLWAGARRGEGFPVPLQGLGIGNGLVDPRVQYRWYPDMARDGGRKEGGTLAQGVITSPVVLGLMKAALLPCLALIDMCNAGGPNATASCIGAYAACNYGELIPYQATGMNPYDMRIKCEHGSLCYDFDAVERFLNDPSVQRQLGVSKRWESCNMLVHALLQADWMKSYDALLPELLANGVRVLVYAGDVDYICNWLGNKHWTTAMAWARQAEYAAAPDLPFVVAGQPAGRLRRAGGLAFLQVFQAGHMVPMDKPAESLAMLNRFLADSW